MIGGSVGNSLGSQGGLDMMPHGAVAFMRWSGMPFAIVEICLDAGFDISSAASAGFNIDVPAAAGFNPNVPAAAGLSGGWPKCV